MLYRKAQYAKEEKEESEQPHHRLDGIALAELVSYIEEFGTSSEFGTSRAPAQCSGGHGFDSCWGLRFNFVPRSCHVEYFIFHI